jgi:PAS domain S-box-containing protein
MDEGRRDDGRPVAIPALCGADRPLEAIFDAVNDGIFISDPETLRFIQINKPGCAMFGYSNAELIGQDIGFLSSGIHPYTQEAALANNERLREGGGQTFEWQCRTKTGELFWAEISVGHPQLDATSVVIAILRDISRRKTLDQDLQLALEKASAANVAKSTFLASVSHELRTPLNAIIGFSDLMLTQRLGPLGNPRYAEYIDDIHRSGLQLLALIDDLLDLSRIDAGKMALSEREISLPLLIADARLTGIASQAIRRRNPDRSFREPSQRLRR